MNKQFKIYLYLQKDALDPININEPLAANWEYRDLPNHHVYTFPTHPPVLNKIKITPMFKQSPLPNNTPRQTWQPSLQSKPSECNSHSSECVAKQRVAAHDSSLCMATCCTGFTEPLIPNKDACAAGVCERKLHALVTPINLAKGFG